MSYTIISSIENDAPFGAVNWCTISFLSPQDIEETDSLEVKGIKVHNGYTAMELATDDAKKIKANNKHHNVFLAELGKLHAWDDVSKADVIEYDNKKLNDLEKTRREQADKIKLMNEQLKNEHRASSADSAVRKEKCYDRLRKKLYDRGLITKKELEMIEEEPKISEKKHELNDSLKQAIDECTTDYLDENTPVALKYGCISIYSPKHIKGLKTLSFKIRGIFQTEKQLIKRTDQLQKLYPNDRIYHFEVGKWCAFSESSHQDSDPNILLKQLNYSMKCYLNLIEHEGEEFEKRKEALKSKTEQESKAKLRNNRDSRKTAKPEPAEKSDASLQNNPEDEANIQKLMNFLDEPELRNKFISDNKGGERVTVSI